MFVLSACYKGIGKYVSEHRFLTPDSESNWTPGAGDGAAAYVAVKAGRSLVNIVLPWLATPRGGVELLAADPASQVYARCGSRRDTRASLDLPGRSLSRLEVEVEAEMQAVSDGMALWRCEDYEEVELIQEAPRNRGCVTLMRSLERRGGFVAVKRMPNTWVTESSWDFARCWPRSSERPWLDMSLVRHLHRSGYSYICEPMGVFRDHVNTYVAAEYAAGGDLFLWMTQGPVPGAEREGMLRPIVRQLYEAVRHLHDFGVVHRDLSLENILVMDKTKPTVKLVDFGMASLSRECRGVCGKRSYVAPEQYLNGEHDGFLSDSFALGVCLFSLATQAYPWQTTRAGYCKQFDFIASSGLQAYIARRRLGGFSLRLGDVLSQSLVDLMEASLHMRPENRACLGERCFSDPAASLADAVLDPPSAAGHPGIVGAQAGEPRPQRASVWDFAWFCEA